MSSVAVLVFWRKELCLSYKAWLVSVNAERLREDMIAVTRNSCLTTSNTNHPELSRPSKQSRRMAREEETHV